MEMVGCYRAVHPLSSIRAVRPDTWKRMDERGCIDAQTGHWLRHWHWHDDILKNTKIIPWGPVKTSKAFNTYVCCLRKMLKGNGVYPLIFMLMRQIANNIVLMVFPPAPQATMCYVYCCCDVSITSKVIIYAMYLYTLYLAQYNLAW